MKISLIGFMGCGKTTIGRLLSKRLGIPFLDLDEIVVKRVGMSIPEIFKRKGENVFRKLESQLLKELLLQNTSFVLSTGGGTPTYLNNAELINRYSKSVYLKTQFNILWERISSDKNRPLTSLGRENLLKLYLRRLPFYHKAHFTVEASFRSPTDVVLSIEKLITTPFQ
jgi:shikimate kinase